MKSHFLKKKLPPAQIIEEKVKLGRIGQHLTFNVASQDVRRRFFGDNILIITNRNFNSCSGNRYC